LSLELFTHSALAEWAQGNTERMTKSIDEVFNNAKSFDDKLRAAEIKLDYEGMTGTNLFEANAFGFHGKSIFSVFHHPQITNVSKCLSRIQTQSSSNLE